MRRALGEDAVRIAYRSSPLANAWRQTAAHQRFGSCSGNGLSTSTHKTHEKLTKLTKNSRKERQMTNRAPLELRSCWEGRVAA